MSPKKVNFSSVSLDSLVSLVSVAPECHFAVIQYICNSSVSLPLDINSIPASIRCNHATQANKRLFVLQTSIGCVSQETYACSYAFDDCRSFYRCFKRSGLSGSRALFDTEDGRQTPINRIIGIEHDGPASLTVVLARKNTAGLVSLENTSNAPVYLSLPDNWNRTEVTNTTIDKVTNTKTQYNFLRWTLPAKAGMKMLLPEVPSSFTFLSPTATNSVALTVHSVDVVDGTKETQVILLQKQAVAKFWTSEASAISTSSSVSSVSSVASSIVSSY